MVCNFPTSYTRADGKCSASRHSAMTNDTSARLHSLLAAAPMSHNENCLTDPARLDTLVAFRLLPDSPLIAAGFDLPVLFGLDEAPWINGPQCPASPHAAGSSAPSAPLRPLQVRHSRCFALAAALVPPSRHE